MKHVKADLVFRDNAYRELSRHPLKSATYDSEKGLKVDPLEIEKLAGAPLEICDGDLGCLALWRKCNHGDPDAYIEYDEALHTD